MECCTASLFLVVLIATVSVVHAGSNSTCLTGSTPFPFNITGCPVGFYCPFAPQSPTFCSPTIECSLQRLSSKLCDPQGSAEPTVCPRGHYCATPLTKTTCPKGYFCSTGTSVPQECPPLSICPAGSFRARFVGSFIMCLIIDLALLAAWLLIKFYPSLSQRYRNTRNLVPNSPNAHHHSAIRAVEMAKKKSTHHIESEGVVSQGLVDGFTRARDNEVVTLLFEFENLNITLPNGLNILQGVSGAIRPGRVTAIMGPSGAGKTTFMNCLMGKVPRTGGNLRINHKDLEIHTLRKVIGYVPQDDVMLSELTVKYVISENIRHSAKIRLPKNWTSKETEDFVDSVLDALDLSHVANTVVGDHTRRGISGGQKKRTNIAMELAGAPLAIFLDEPTSGLDSTAALKVAEILKDMAQLGITVVAVIHQPRHEIFALFDDILMVAPGGVTAYLGPQENVVNYFRQMGFVFDPYINQADQLMDVLSGKGTKENSESYSVQEIIDFWLESEAERSHREAAQASDSDSKSLATIKRLGQERGGNFFIQALLCHNRSLIQQFRLIPALVLEIGVAILAGGLMGLATGVGGSELYRGVLIVPFTILSAAPIEWAVPLYALLFGMAIGLAGGPAGVNTFGEERQVYFREAAAGHGRFAYFLGKSISVLYRQVLSALHFSMVYHLLAKPLTPFRAIFSVVFLFFFCVYGLAAVVSMLVRRENASLLGVVVCLFAAVFNGFGPSLTDARSWGMGWLWDMSYARWLSEAMYTQEVLPYAAVYEVYKVSEPQFGYTLGRFAQDCGLAFVIGVVLRAAAFFLMIVTKRKMQK